MNQRLPLTLKKRYEQYVTHNREFHVPAVASLWGCSEDELIQCIVDDPVGGNFVDGLWVRGYSHPSKWVYEVCNTTYNRGNILLDKYRDTYIKSNRKLDQHISVFKHDEKWVETVRQTGKVANAKGYVTSDFIYIEIDRKNEDVPVRKSYLDALEIVKSFPYPEAFTISYSGNNSIHLYLDSTIFGSPIAKAEDVTGMGRLFYNLAHYVAGDVRYKNGLVDSWLADWDIVEAEYTILFGELPSVASQARQTLENIDPNIYNKNSLIRQPYSKHPTTGLLAAPVSNIDEYGNPTYNLTKEFVYGKSKPYLLGKTFELYERKKRWSGKQIDIPNQIIKETYQKLYNDFGNNEPNEDGWISNLYNPFYEDTNPSVSININDGRFHDFGNPDYQFDFITLYAKVNNINKQQAKKRLRCVK